MHLPDIYDDDRPEPEELLWGDDEPTPESDSESEQELESESEQEESDDEDGPQEGDLGECYDLDLDDYGNKITDDYGDGCEEYAQNLDWCGQWNTADF